MTDVVIAGIGQTPVGEHWDISLRELSLQAIETAVADSGGLHPQMLVVGNMLAPLLSHQSHLGALISDFAGLNGIEALTTEAAGASGGAALRTAYLAIASGQADVVLVVGVEKFTDQIGSTVDAALSSAGDSDFEAVQGLTPTAQAAMLMRRYLHEYQVPPHAFAGFPLTAHANGVSNPNAMYRKAISAGAYQKAGMVSEPLNMFDVAPYADGAAALVLTRSDLLPPGYAYPQVRIAGSSVVTDTLALHDRPDPLVFEAAHLLPSVLCGRLASPPTRQTSSSCTTPSRSTPPCRWRLPAMRNVARAGSWPRMDGLAWAATSPSPPWAGLKARGNPGGATGVYQAVEATLQLRGCAGGAQVPGARRALIQCLGGPASSAITHVLERME